MYLQAIVQHVAAELTCVNARKHPMHDHESGCCSRCTTQSCRLTPAAAFQPFSTRRSKAPRSAAFSNARQQSVVRCAAASGVDQDIEALNAKFGIPEHGVTVKAGRGGLPMVHLQHACGATAEVRLDAFSLAHRRQMCMVLQCWRRLTFLATLAIHLQVYLFGGAVISWKMASGDEVLYVRPDAKFDK